MLIVVLACVLLIAATTLIHYEALRVLNTRLITLPIPARSKLLVVIFAAFAAHLLEIAVYAAAVYGLVEHMDVGALHGAKHYSFLTYLYFSAETYTTLGFGDLTPSGAIRLLAGVESLNGLLLIGWTATSTYVAMERFWNGGVPR
jgi:voltage-gated potassium channel Kch